MDYEDALTIRNEYEDGITPDDATDGTGDEEEEDGEKMGGLEEEESATDLEPDEE
ncbi:MAG: hypothetical protein HYW98_00030 [Candidatus Wildermuthbacteria bacterium]|nr:hypothetical protein [Candidatus Wildermuthbacteria bacterium]